MVTSEKSWMTVPSIMVLLQGNSLSLENLWPYHEQTYLKSAETGLDTFWRCNMKMVVSLQFYPYNKGYVTQITYNDDAMINALKVLRDVARGQEEFSVLSENLRSESKCQPEKGFLYFKTQLYS